MVMIKKIMDTFRPQFYIFCQWSRFTLGGGGAMVMLVLHVTDEVGYCICSICT